VTLDAAATAIGDLVLGKRCEEASGRECSAIRTLRYRMNRSASR
jgi:hypothetical protein